MKKIILSLSLLLAAFAGQAQKVKISGKMLNLTDKALEIVSHGTFYLRDSIPVNADGTFSYENDKITGPIHANLTNRKQVQVQLFLAPGYDLHLTSDVKDYATFKSTLRYAGMGSLSNSYWTKVYTEFKPDTVKWLKKDGDTYIKSQMTLPQLDVFRKAVFNDSNKELFSDHFREALELNSKFSVFNGLFGSYAYENNLSWAQIQQLIAKTNIDLEKELNDPKNLISNSFCYLVENYAFYCQEYKAFPADSVKANEDGYSLYLRDKLFTGKVYDHVMASYVRNRLSTVVKDESIARIIPYVEKISSQETREALGKLIAERKTHLNKLQAGNPSPTFALTDPAGKVFKLEDFKGKVVYLDLWASWCGPCKEENPHLKKLYDTYKENDKLAIISIATFDAKNRDRRYEIIKKDGMTWLQLEDTTDSFAKSYFANSIPRFIIIDKKGNIVDNDAPRPSEPDALKNILERELTK